jgi:transcriptional regulator PpsR
MTSELGSMFLVQLMPADLATNAPPSVRAEPTAVDEFIDRMPDAFVVIDREGLVRRTNRSFLDLIQQGGEGAVLGERLSRWLSRPGADLAVLMSNLQRHGSVRLFATAIQGELGTETAVEISAVGSPATRPTHFAMLLRDVGRRLPVDQETGSLHTALRAIVEQTGNTSLRTRVKDTVGLVERHYIGVALELADGNRTAAAELLGLSRQGFYKKLAQYEADGHSRAGSYSEE